VRYEKGHLFEVVVAKFFEYKGYEVKKNERFRGASGAVHEIDVALYKGGKLVGVVEAKNYDKPVPKE
jgi:Holliday junction resolvase-like predicted endonuclease